MARRRRSVPEWTGHSRQLTATGGAVWETASAAHKAVGLWVRAYGYQISKAKVKLNNRQLGNYAAVYVSRGEGTFDSPPTGTSTLARIAASPSGSFTLPETSPAVASVTSSS